MKLQTKLLLTFGLLVLLLYSAIQVFVYQKSRQIFLEDYLNQGRSIRSLIMSTRRVYQLQFLESGLPLTDQTLGFLPVHALGKISRDLKNWPPHTVSFTNVSTDPRNPENQANAFEEEAIRYFMDNPDAQERLVPLTKDTGERLYHYTTPIRIETYCLECHGKPEDAPLTIQRQYGQGFNYDIGELKGILSIKMSSKAIEEKTLSQFTAHFLSYMVGFVLIMILFYWLLRQAVFKKLEILQQAANRVAQGNYTGMPTFQGNDEFASVSSAFHDMSAAISTREDHLRQSEQRTAAIIDSVKESIVTVDRSHQIQGFNPAACELFDYTEEEVVGKNLNILLPLDLHDLHRQKVARVIQSSDRSPLGKGPVEITAFRRDGTPFAGEVSLSEMSLGQEQLLVGIIRDITTRKETEDALRKLDMMKNHFISIAAHELRTPLASVMGYSELLLNPGTLGEFSPQQQEEFLREIYDQAQSLSRITDDLLDVSRIEGGRPLPLHKASCCIGELLHKVVAHILMLSPDHQIHLELTDPLPSAFPMDQGKITQVVENILTNAVKYSPVGSAIRIEGKTSERSYLVVIEDEGIGMTQEQVDKIFEKFYRADTSDTAVRGLGLGMAIVKDIVERHGGQVWVKSRLGAGTSVFFTLPLDS